MMTVVDRSRGRGAKYKKRRRKTRTASRAVELARWMRLAAFAHCLFTGQPYRWWMAVRLTQEEINANLDRLTKLLVSWGHARRINDADEYAQEILLRIRKRLRKRAIWKPRTFLYRCLVNFANDRAKQTARTTMAPLEHDAADAASLEPGWTMADVYEHLKVHYPKLLPVLPFFMAVNLKEMRAPAAWKQLRLTRHGWHAACRRLADVLRDFYCTSQA